MKIIVDDISFDVLADHYAKHGFKALPTTPTMSACEILAMRGQDAQYCLVELLPRDTHGTIWGQRSPLREDHGEWSGGEWDATHRPTTDAIILSDGLRFASLPPCGY